MPTPRKKRSDNNTETNGENKRKDPEACLDVNEGIPSKPLPNKNLPEMIGAKKEDAPKEEKKGKAKDGIEKALDILDEYYEETPPRDQRFHHDEE
jgi:hypothetical protein